MGSVARPTLRRRPRPLWGAALGVVAVVALSAAMIPVRGDATRVSPALVLVVAIVLAGVVGGRPGAVVAAIAALVAFNVVFIPPYWTWKIDATEDAIAFAVFAVVALAVGTLVAREGERRQSAEDRAADLESLNEELRRVEREREHLEEEATRAAVLARVDEQRAALLRSVSHDLRTPLATIRAVVSDLQGDVAYDVSTRAELLSLVAGEVERLDRLVANLLSLSRIEAGALRPDRQAVALDELVNETVRRLDRLLTQRRVQVDLPTEALVDGDFTQLDQVMTNLLENAARHAPATSTVRVGGRVLDEMVEVWVDDEGFGIPLFERDRIFEPFRRGEGSASSGIGLAICKAIVEAHDGSIAAEAAPGGGARFRISLPRHHDRG